MAATDKAPADPPLDTTPAVEGTDYTTTEGWWTPPGSDVKLYQKFWLPTGDVKARMVWIHGFSDYINNTGPFLPYLAKKGVAIYAWDQRGAGLSVHKPKDKGDMGPTPQVLSDITGFIQRLPAAHADKPLFVAGHSMGGGETLYYIARGDPEIHRRVRGYVAVSPLVGLSPDTKPAWLLEKAGRLAVRALPKFQFKNPVKAHLLTHDPDVNRAFELDELCECVGTLQLFQGMLDRGAELDEGAVAVREPELGRKIGSTGLLLCHGTADGITWAESSRRFMQRVEWEDKEFRPYDGWFHVPFREKGDDKFRFAAELAAWVLERAA